MDEDYRIKESWWSLVRRLLRNALIFAAVLFVLTIVVCWLIGWRDFYMIGQGMFFAGVGAMALGFLSIVGNLNNRGSFGYQFSRSVSHQHIGDRAVQDMRDVFATNAFMITMLVTGVIVILIGYIFQLIGGA